jgi:hypothetical protein
VEDKKVKRCKWLIALLLPLIACVFYAGWILYCLGNNSKANKQKLSQKHQVENVSVGLLEEAYNC